MPSDSFQWQEPGEAWKGIGIYHVTLTIPSRETLLGELIIPDGDPSKAEVKRSQLGEDLVDCLMHLYEHYPEVRILQFCLMPDHLHVIWHVRKPMPRGIMSVARGFWQAAKKLGRNYTSSIETIPPQGLTSSLTGGYYPPLSSIFSEMPFVRPLVRQGQLRSMFRYIDMNPSRLATKRLKPGFFCVQTGIEIGGRTYSGVGNIRLLQHEHYAPVHVRSMWIKDAEEHGYDRPLRDYMNSCVLAAHQGTILVSPFISKQEQAVMSVLLKENLPFIYLAENGFRDYYKPSEALFDAVAAGSVLILSPWEYDPSKKHISRSDCVALNTMAEEICTL